MKDACLAGYEALYASVSGPIAKDADIAGDG